MVGISSSTAPARFCSSRTIRSIFFEHPETERQPGIDAGGGLLDHRRAQHELVGDDLGLFGRLAQDRQEIAGKEHGRPIFWTGRKRERGSTVATSRPRA